MSIHFSKERWDNVEKNYEAWWNGTLERSLFKVVVKNAYDAEREKPNVPLLSQVNCNDLSYSPEEIIDAIDYELSTYEFLGDAFPFVNMAAFGASALAGFCGARMENSTGNVWYFMEEKMEIEQLKIRYNPESVWATRIKDIYRAGQKKWGNMVLFSMPDLGGCQDVLATMLGSDELLCSLIEEPEEVIRLQQEVYKAFFDAYEDFGAVLKPFNRGYSDWGGLFSKEPSYILQDDFAFMISPSMFNEFALQDLENAAKRLKHSIYHLDGVGNLNHLDSILSLKNLDAVQWVYGSGQPTALNWIEVYDKIINAGKKVEIIGSLSEFEQLDEKYKRGLFYHVLVDDNEGTAVKSMDYKDCLNDYHVVPIEKLPEVKALLHKMGLE